MRLLLIRHAPAEDRETFARTGRDDGERPLTDEGRRKMRRAARGLARLVDRIDLLASSPLVRAVQTAEIVADAYGRLEIVQSGEWAPQADPRAILPWLKQHESRDWVAAVGHEPHVGACASWLLAERTAPFFVFKKGGACLLEFEDGVDAGVRRSCGRCAPRISGGSVSEVAVERALWVRPAEETARAVALARLDEAAAALSRLDDPSDDEALHDFRVAVRRLRSILRAYRPYLKGTGAKKLRRELGELARSTGAARDAEVQLAWLDAQEPRLPPRQRAGARCLRGRFEARLEQADTGTLARVRNDFERVARKTRRRFPEFALRVRVGEAQRGTSWQAVTGELLREHARELRDALAAVDSAERQTEAHRARIRGKRLRYLLETLREGEERARDLLQRLKELQDLLGEWNDRHIVQREIAAALQELAAERARALYEAAVAGAPSPRVARTPSREGERAGLLALARIAQSRQEQLFHELCAAWGDDAGGFFHRLGSLASDLTTRRTDSTEIERKYLLRALPPGVEGAPAHEIEQGYLPGKRWQERLRRVRAGDGERYYRTVKLGVGVERTEIEEETDAELFERLWPLTEGRRVRKRRYRVEDDGRIWEIDAFLDRDLVLAEVELDRPDEDATPPDWLRPVVVRDVTDAPEYQNVRLAR